MYLYCPFLCYMRRKLSHYLLCDNNPLFLVIPMSLTVTRSTFFHWRLKHIPHFSCAWHHPPRAEAGLISEASLRLRVSDPHSLAASASAPAASRSEDDLRDLPGLRGQPRGWWQPGLQPLLAPALTDLRPQLPGGRARPRGLQPQHPGHARQPPHGVYSLGE